MSEKVNVNFADLFSPKKEDKKEKKEIKPIRKGKYLYDSNSDSDLPLDCEDDLNREHEWVETIEYFDDRTRYAYLCDYCGSNISWKPSKISKTIKKDRKTKKKEKSIPKTDERDKLIKELQEQIKRLEQKTTQHEPKTTQHEPKSTQYTPVKGSTKYLILELLKDKPNGLNNRQIHEEILKKKPSIKFGSIRASTKILANNRLIQAIRIGDMKYEKYWVLK